jgi:hypothetical protein
MTTKKYAKDLLLADLFFTPEGVWECVEYLAHSTAHTTVYTSSGDYSFLNYNMVTVMAL